MNTINNIAIVNLVIEDTIRGTHNGNFIPVFQAELEAFAAERNVPPETYRIFLFLLARVDSNNTINTSIQDMMLVLKLSRSCIYRSLNVLVTMKIICQLKNSKNRRFSFDEKIINPRLAFRGDTRRIKKGVLPLLMRYNGSEKLIPNSLSINSDFWDLLGPEKEFDK